jgi:hypothetical protein
MFGSRMEGLYPYNPTQSTRLLHTDSLYTTRVYEERQVNIMASSTHAPTDNGLQSHSDQEDIDDRFGGL